MRRVSVWLLMAAFLAISVTASAADTKQIEGSVVFACPKGKAVKVKSGDAEVMLWVHPKCPKRKHLAAQIKALKAGDKVAAKYVAREKKNYLTEITKK